MNRSVRVKSWRIAVVLLLSLVLTSFVACNPFDEGEAEVTEELVEVVRGDLTVIVSGSGYIEVSKEAKIAFGTGGRVEEISVEEGDKVSQGEILARLETDAMELALAQTQIGRVQAQAAQAQAQVGQVQAHVAQAQAEVALSQAQAGQIYG